MFVRGGGGAFFSFLQVDFFLPASERECLWCGKWRLPLFAGRFFSTRVVSGVAVSVSSVSATFVCGYYF